jgi:hypothetical protein
MIQKEFP